MLDSHSMLALFVLLALSAGIFLLSKRTKIPYTILLVLTGILIVPIVQLPVLKETIGFLGELTLTPELLFFIFLPALIFESAFNVNIRRMIDSIWSISLLAVVGLMISAVLIAGALYFLLPLVGLPIPFIVALLFGGIISATDPVAVLSLFKEVGVPKRLAMIFEGESLLNDGTAIAIFLIVLGIIQQGTFDAGTIADGSLMFVGMLGFGVILGLVIAVAFSLVLRLVRANAFVAATILLVSAHITFIAAEIINETGLFGMSIHVSSIIATTVSALFLGNYSRHILSDKADDYLTKVTEHIAFMANSLVFLLAGLLFASADVDYRNLAVPILVTVAVVMIVRAISVFAITTPINMFKLEQHIPFKWQVLLSWGSLRGALAIIIVLLVPESLTVTGWTLEYSVRDILLALTIGCILATLFIKAPMIPWMIRKLGLDKPEPLADAYQTDFGLYYLYAGKQRFDQHKTKGFVRDAEYAKLNEAIQQKIDLALSSRDELVREHGKKLFEQSLHMTAIRIEEHSLKQLYNNNEISEDVFRRIIGKLHLQQEQIEVAQHDEIDPSKHKDRKDIFDSFVAVISYPIKLLGRPQKAAEKKLQYYRAQMIIARKVTKQLKIMQDEHEKPVFIESVYDKVYAKYDLYRKQCSQKVDDLLAAHESELAPYIALLAERALDSSGARALGYLHASGVSSEEAEIMIREKYSISVER